MTPFCDSPPILRNCHYPFNDTFLRFPTPNTKLSLTGQWQFWCTEKMKEYTLWFVIDWALDQWEGLILCSRPMRSPEMRMIPGFTWKVYLSLTGQWHFCKGPHVLFAISQLLYQPKLSLTSQWHFSEAVLKLSLTGQWQFIKVPKATFWRPTKTVIDWSMIVSKRP